VNNENLPALEDVPFVFKTPDGMPKGVLTAPRAGTAAVMLCDLEDMVHFALQYDWATNDQATSARGWAGATYRLIQIQSTLEQFKDGDDAVSEDESAALTYACSCARMLQPGSSGNLTMAGYTDSEIASAGYRVALGVGALANDNHDESGKVTWRGFRSFDGTARKAFYDQMIKDVRAGAYLYG
jgi:hypothetical protein